MAMVLGWREWIALPDLGIPAIKAKLDTGAKTSTLHAFDVRADVRDGIEVACFRVHPRRKHRETIIDCVAPIADRRVIRDSGGHAEERLIIRTRLVVGGLELETDMSLTDRDNMLFPVLIGRRALVSGNVLVDSQLSYVTGRKRRVAIPTGD